MSDDTAALQSSMSDSLLPRWGHVCLFVILAAFSLAPIWISTHFPSQNGPWYLLIVHMFKEFHNPAFDYSEYYQINWHPVPHMFHNVVVLGLSYLMPLLTAEKVALSIYVIGFPLSIFYFLSAVSPRNMVLGYFSFLMIHTYSFYRGYHNFSLSLVFFFTAFGYWLHHRSKLTIKDLAVLAVLSLMLYLSHLFVFALLACCIGYYVLIETHNFKKGTIAALSVTWPGWLFFIDYYILTKTQAEWIDHEDTEFLLPHEAVEYFVRKYFYTISLPTYILAAAPWLLLAYLLCRKFAQMHRENQAFWKPALRDPIIALLGILLIGYFIVPFKFMAWHYVNLRMIPVIFGIMLACAATGTELNRRFQSLLILTIGVATLSVSGLLAQEVVKMDQELDVYLSGIDYYDGKTPLLPIIVENSPYGQVRPLTKAHEYYNIAKGGANGKGVARVNTLVSMWYLEYPPDKMFPKYDEENISESMKLIRETYGYVLIYGDQQDIFDNLKDSEFQLVHHQGKLRLFKNQSGELVSTRRESN